MKNNKLGLEICNFIRKTESASTTQFFSDEKIFYYPEVLLINADNIIFNTDKSQNESIKLTYKYFTGKTLTDDLLFYTKNLGGYQDSCKLLKYLIEQYGFNFSIDDIETQYNSIYWNDAQGLIENEELLIRPEFLEQLSNRFTLVAISSSDVNQLSYKLHKYTIAKYFSLVDTCKSITNTTNPVITAKQNLQSDKICIVGASLDDMRLAIKENILGIAVCYDTTTVLNSMLISNGAHKVCKNFYEIIRFIDSIGTN